MLAIILGISLYNMTTYTVLFVCLFVLLLYVPSQQLWSWRRNNFTINLHESMGPCRDRNCIPWICSQTRLCSQTSYRLGYAARLYLYSTYKLKKHTLDGCHNSLNKGNELSFRYKVYMLLSRIFHSCITTAVLL